MNKQKQKKPSGCVIAIFPNSQGYGYAVMQDALTLMSSQVVKVRPVCNSKNLARIKRDIEYYEPTLVILEDFETNKRKSKRVKRLLLDVNQYASMQNIPVALYSRSDIRYVFSNFKATTKHEIASVIADNIPAVKDKLQEKPKLWEGDKYYTGLFDAVSLAMTHYYLVP